MTKDAIKQCVACERGEDETPLVCLEYRNQRMWICPQHLPILIHNPGQLVGRIPGAENLKPADTHD